MAELLLARTTGPEGFERHVVIKQMHEVHGSDPKLVEMFMTEARLAAALNHHNIVQVHDVGFEDDRHYFAMEYVHGEDLRKLLAKLYVADERISFELAIWIGAAVAAALEHAHSRTGPDRAPLGIVHRDVTPSNIIVTYDGHVKVVDFGIAKAA